MTEVLKQALGAHVRAARKRAGLTQESLAARIGKTPESVSNIERGRQLPMLDTLDDLARVLGVSLVELFKGADGPARSTRRVRLEAELDGLVRTLDDDALATAVAQIEVLARGARR